MRFTGEFYCWCESGYALLEYIKTYTKLPFIWNTNYRLMQVKSIAECSIKTFVLSILSGRLRQVLLYVP